MLRRLLIAGAPQTDPDWASVVTLLHFNGTDASTTITDETGKTWTASGDAQIDTAQSVFGGASLLMDGTGDYASTADSADWDFGTGDFTIEARIRFAGSVSTFVIASNYTSSTSGWFFRYASGQIQFGSSGDTPINSQTWTPSFNTWYAVSTTRASGEIRFFIDGTELGTSITNTESITGATATLKIGSLNGSVQFSNGHVDELRITKGVARYTSSYTPSGAEFPNS